MVSRTIELISEQATTALGRWLGANLFPGAVIALNGQLGAGKTYLTRAIAEGLAVADSRLVTSPTFVLMQEHHGRLTLHHFDVYRLASESAFEDLGVNDLLESDGVCVIEWADRVPTCLPNDLLRIILQVVGPTTRRAILEATGHRHAELVTSLNNSFVNHGS